MTGPESALHSGTDTQPLHPVPLHPAGDPDAIPRRPPRHLVALFDDPTEHQPQHAIPAPVHSRTPDGPDRELRRYEPDSLRRQVVERLMLVGRRHARHLTDLHATPDRPGPHVIVFCYPRTLHDGTEKLAIATRMFLDGPDVTDLAEILHTLHERARGFHAGGRFDPRRHLSNSGEHLAALGRYHGIATSTVHPAGPGQTGPSWQGLARLVDGTRLLMHTTTGISPTHVETTHTLDVPAMLALSPLYSWRWAPPDPPPDPRYAPTDLEKARGALDELHTFITNSALLDATR